MSLLDNSTELKSKSNDIKAVFSVFSPAASVMGFTVYSSVNVVSMTDTRQFHHPLLNSV